MSFLSLASLKAPKTYADEEFRGKKTWTTNEDSILQSLVGQVFFFRLFFSFSFVLIQTLSLNAPSVTLLLYFYI
jgi:hypothetical protein